MLKLTAKDIRGVVSMHPTPSKPNAGDWRETNSVDLDTSKKLWDLMLKGGIAGFALCGTTGECAGLLWDEKKEYISTAVETIKKRAYTFAGATSLGTKETIRQMREFQKMGADGAFVGLPLWQTPTMENMVQFYADLGDAVPDFPVMIYSNSMFFKTMFPVEFWAGIGKKAMTVITNKISYPMDHLEEDVKVATDRVQFIPGKAGSFVAFKKVGTKVRGLWTTDPSPEPYVAISNAIQKNDLEAMDLLQQEFNALPKRNPTEGPGFQVEFPSYNAQIEREGWNAGTFLKVGPMRPPYRDLPDYWVRSIGIYEHAFEQLRKKYIGIKPV